MKKVTEAAGSAPTISVMVNQSPPVSHILKVHTPKRLEHFATDLVCQGTFSGQSFYAFRNKA